MTAGLTGFRLARRTTTGLPLASLPPAFIREMGGLAHVIAADTSGQGAVHAALDREGASVSAMRALPVSPVAAAVSGNAVVVAGVHQRTRVRCAMGVDGKGEPLWEITLPMPVSGLVWIAPVCVTGEPVIVWEVVSERAGELGVAAVREGRLLPPVGSSRVDLQACKLEYSIVSPK